MGDSLSTENGDREEKLRTDCLAYPCYRSRLLVDPNQLVKDNIAALLKLRQREPEDLAKHVKNSADWIEKIFRYPNRTFPIRYWPAIAKFLGVELYQLLQTGGINPDKYERRSGSDRRKNLERRVSSAITSEKPLDLDIVHLARALTTQGRRRAVEVLVDILNSELPRSQTTPDVLDAQGHTDEKPRATRARKR